MTSRGGTLPEKIGAYEVVSELGRGGMGVVYLARDPRLERPVALKVLSPELSRNREWSARFTREARLLASLNHPNIAIIHSLESDGGVDFLTMELISGRSLEDVLRSGPLTIPDALSIGRQIARGLEAAHDAGVIHRDLKPLNVMVTPESHAKVLDFGLATRAVTSLQVDAASAAASLEDAIHLLAQEDAATVVSDARIASDSGHQSSASTGAGTPGYMSPEQIRGREVDSRTDVWAFGCVLYECLSGTRVFGGRSNEERVRASLDGPLDLAMLPARTPPAIRELIRSCLERDRAGRLTSIAEARQILETALAQRSWESAADRGELGAVAERGDTPHNLPHEVSPFVGRRREIARILDALEHARLVTLTGIGGGGKTRLATRIGKESLSRFPEGVWMVELAPTTEDADLARAVAQVLGVAEAPGRSLTEGIVARVANGSLLLILDNCEHVIEGAAKLARALLASTPEIKILATSRELLGLSGESSVQVPPLELAARGSLSFEALASNEAVELFAQRATQVRSDFALRPENIEDVAEICRRLEGIPLAIELAAARTKVLPLGEISRRLDDRFRLLKGTSRAALPHHQTLEALIEWSHAHLTENEQRLFRRLSLFRGGWTLEAAEAVCADEALEEWEVVDVLTRLIDKSLVVFNAGGGEAMARSPAGSTSVPRYRMLETVREFAQARSQESPDGPETEGRFQSYFTKLVEASAAELTGPMQGEWLARIDADLDNVRAATNRALAGADSQQALHLTSSMLRYRLIRGHWREGRETLERAIAMPGAQEPTQFLGFALNSLGTFCYQLHALDDAKAHYRRAVDLLLALGRIDKVSAPLMNLGNVHRMRGDFDASDATLMEALGYIAESDTWMNAAAQYSLGNNALLRDDYATGRARFESALALHRKLGDHVHEALGLMALGLIAYRQERWADARAHYRAATAMFDELGDRNFGTAVRINFGIALLAMGETAEALETFTKGLRMAQEVGSLENMTASLEGLSQIAGERGDQDRSVRLAAAADGMRTKFEMARAAADHRLWDDGMRALATQVGEERFARLWAEGAALDREAAIALGLQVGADAVE